MYQLDQSSLLQRMQNISIHSSITGVIVALDKTVKS